MNTFQLQQMQFYDIYDASEDDPYIMIFDANKKEITKAEFDDKYESDFQLLPEGCTFRWTKAGIKSPFFKEAEFTSSITARTSTSMQMLPTTQFIPFPRRSSLRIIPPDGRAGLGSPIVSALPSTLTSLLTSTTR